MAPGLERLIHTSALNEFPPPETRKSTYMCFNVELSTRRA
jgi:hypothetical protein